ncbi:alpha/beta hydrolase [Sporosarcina sp. Sa2YVA2]|uniref:Alpha/beta hydrolase n=1 Tax=Sporosarcina quadrami TaxID=2762234 RepID=A0ABR8UD85_9BACL|nr:alpha/beta hydrolase [Sporosarcina quadrami]MBD7985997.1 alpha/beta hydrolase [Sporosarcina quadrami]
MIYDEYGDKHAPLLVFIHGGGVGGWMWDKQISYFGEYYCIVPTLQGHGDRSDENTFSIRENAIELIDLIKEKGTGKNIHIVGFSIGAQICLEMIHLAPALITTAVVNSATVIPMKFVSALIAPTIKMTFPLIKNKSFAKLQAKQLYMDGEYFERYYEDSLKMKAATLVEILKENMSYSLPDNLAESATRILVTVGDKEKGLLLKSAKKIVDCHKKTEMHIIPNMGHGLPIADPRLFNEIVEKWIMEDETR